MSDKVKALLYEAVVLEAMGRSTPAESHKLVSFLSDWIEDKNSGLENKESVLSRLEKAVEKELKAIEEESTEKDAEVVILNFNCQSILERMNYQCFDEEISVETFERVETAVKESLFNPNRDRGKATRDTNWRHGLNLYLEEIIREDLSSFTDTIRRYKFGVIRPSDIEFRYGNALKFGLSPEGYLCIFKMPSFTAHRSDLLVGCTERDGFRLEHVDVAVSVKMKCLVARDSNYRLVIYNIDHQYVDHIAKKDQFTVKRFGIPLWRVDLKQDVHPMENQMESNCSSRRIIEYMEETKVVVDGPALSSFCLLNNEIFGISKTGDCIKVSLTNTGGLTRPRIKGQTRLPTEPGINWYLIKANYGMIVVAGKSESPSRMWLAILNTNLRLSSIRSYDRSSLLDVSISLIDINRLIVGVTIDRRVMWWHVNDGCLTDCRLVMIDDDK